ncbi:MAG: EamA family transporter [Trueperaceae bacterium]|nr:EamA family transporter [Trueperaceae bacterium]
MTWWAFALAAGLASALNVAASKRLVARMRPALLGGVVHLTGGLLCLIALPLVGADLAPAGARVPELVLMTGVYVAGNLLYFTALARTQLSEIDLFLRSSALWTVVGGTVVLGERFPALAFVGAALVLVSLVTVAQRPARLRFSAAQRLALAAAVAFGVGNVVDKAISAPFDPLGYTALNLVLTGMGMLALARPRRAELAAPALWRPTAWIVATTFAATQWLLVLAFAAGGTAGGVILVAQVRLVVLTGVGVVWLGERDRVGRKLLAAALMVTGVAALVAGG